MPSGPGKYDAVCTQVRVSTMAKCVVLIVLDGQLGSGFSVQCIDRELLAALPAMLENTARDMRADQEREDGID